MPKQLTIKEIAKLSGVSAGTVDRVLHNRGSVADDKRKAVEKVLAEVKYKYNIHTSAISFKKTINLTVTTPEDKPGEYWASLHRGIDRALEEYSDIDIHCLSATYDQFDIYSCRETFKKIVDGKPDGVIIGPTFEEETIRLCKSLERNGIPYIFVDSSLEQVSPVASFTTEQFACGSLLARLLYTICPPGSEFAILESSRVGDQYSHNSSERRKGFEKYLDSKDALNRCRYHNFSTRDLERTSQEIAGFLKAYPKVRGIGVMNSRSHIISDILDKNGRDDIYLVGFDLTEGNIRCVNDGKISVLLCQKPEQQGFSAVTYMIEHLLYKKPQETARKMMPIDIITAENLPYYSSF